MRTRTLAPVALALATAVSACSGGDGSRAQPGSTVGTTTRATSAPATTTSAASTATVQPGPQREEAPLPAAVQEVGATVASGRFYVVGGYGTQRNSVASVFVFDGASWSTGPALPIAVNHPAAATIGTDVYVAGGFSSGGATNRAFVLSSGATTWREIAPMQRPRGALALLAAGSRLYAIGGLAGSVQVAVPEMYDPASNTWSDLPAMPHPRNHLAGYLDGSLLCVAGGREPQTSAQVDCFDPATSTWQTRTPLPDATSGAAATILGGVTMVAGGEPSSETSVLGSIQELRGAAWSTVPMLVPRHGTGSAVYHGRMWMCGGATAPGYHAVADCTSAAP